MCIKLFIRRPSSLGRFNPFALLSCHSLKQTQYIQKILAGLVCPAIHSQPLLECVFISLSSPLMVSIVTQDSLGVVFLHTAGHVKQFNFHMQSAELGGSKERVNPQGHSSGILLSTVVKLPTSRGDCVSPWIAVKIIYQPAVHLEPVEEKC